MIKICKNVISMILILLLAIPSYCAGVGSDPSAFVTKEEVDNTFEDFQKRLTAFETGINSKIDSQVTSYLDRNGIWSAKETKLDDNKKSMVFISNISKGGNAVKTLVWTGPRSYNTAGERWSHNKQEEKNVYAYKDNIDRIRTVGIKKMPKSGLCVMPLILRTSYFCSTKDEGTVINKIKAGTTPGDTPVNQLWWISNYYADGGEYCKKDIDKYVNHENAYWQGSYYFPTSIAPWISNCFSQSLNIYNGTQLRYNIRVNQLWQQPNTAGWEDHGDHFYCAPFGDPIVKEVAMFFVDKDKSLEFESQINHTGWDLSSFKCMHPSQMMILVIQPEKIEVY